MKFQDFKDKVRTKIQKNLHVFNELLNSYKILRLPSISQKKFDTGGKK